MTVAGIPDSRRLEIDEAERPGEKVTVVKVFPLRDGDPGGLFSVGLRDALANGEVLTGARRWPEPK